MVQWKDNYDLFKSFVTKEIQIYSEFGSITFLAPSIRDWITNDNLSKFVTLFKDDFKKTQELFAVWGDRNSFEVFSLLMVEIGSIKEFIQLQDIVKKGFQSLIKEEITYDKKNNFCRIGDIILTPELWEYIFYLIGVVLGEKTEKPRVFASDEERRFFEKIKENEERIKKLRKQGNKKEMSTVMMNFFIQICYAFPSFTFFELYDLTYAQLLSLWDYAARAIQYNIEEKAFAAGNMKKKIKFFTEK